MAKIKIDVQNQCDQCGEAWTPVPPPGTRITVPTACPWCYSPEVFQVEVRWIHTPAAQAPRPRQR